MADNVKTSSYSTPFDSHAFFNCHKNLGATMAVGGNICLLVENAPSFAGVCVFPK